MFITKNNEVSVFGDNECGQLGMSNWKKFITEPEINENVNMINKISRGYVTHYFYHMMDLYILAGIMGMDN